MVKNKDVSLGFFLAYISPLLGIDIGVALNKKTRKGRKFGIKERKPRRKGRKTRKI